MRQLLCRLWHAIRQRRVEADLDEELETHRELKEAESRSSGLSAAEAALETRRQLWNLTLTRENARAVWIGPWPGFCERGRSDRVQRTVVDRTGLTGVWDFTLTYTPEASQIPPGVLAPGTPPPPGDPNAPSIFTALDEQLGLKLESTRRPVDVLVIDHVERPTPD